MSCVHSHNGHYTAHEAGDLMCVHRQTVVGWMRYDWVGMLTIRAGHQVLWPIEALNAVHNYLNHGNGQTLKGRRARRRQAYRTKVWALTNQHHPPRRGWTREHHVPISYCFEHGISAELCGSPENVSYVKANDNFHKFTRLDGKGRENLRRWGYAVKDIDYSIE